MSNSGKAVFLSYASQDADAALRLCAGLRAAGVEVWFDQLQHGVSTPSNVLPALVRFDSFWSRLADDPRFEQILGAVRPH